MTIEIKQCKIEFDKTQCKQVKRDGFEVGTVAGHIATFDLDRGDFFGRRDQFLKGAFLESLQDFRKRDRDIRLKDHHGRTIGIFPIKSVHEDEIGLFGIGELNLGVQQGKEAFALAKQGALSDFSIGFTIDKSTLDEQEEIRTISKATIWEGSIVDEPMNPFANITTVKSFAKGILKSIEFESGEDVKEKYKMTEQDFEDIIIKELAKFAKEEIDDEPTKINDEQFKSMSQKEFENALKKTGLFSRSICKMIASKSIENEDEEQDDINSPPQIDKKEFSDVVKDINNFTNQLKSNQC